MNICSTCRNLDLKLSGLKKLKLFFFLYTVLLHDIYMQNMIRYSIKTMNHMKLHHLPHHIPHLPLLKFVSTGRRQNFVCDIHVTLHNVGPFIKEPQTFLKQVCLVSQGSLMCEKCPLGLNAFLT